MGTPQAEGRHGAFVRGVAALKEAGITNPALDAAILLGYAAGEAPDTVLLDRKSTLAPSEAALYDALIRKRCTRVAVSRVVGGREFYSRHFKITDDVFDPRPDTEILVEEAIRYLEKIEGDPTALEIGTGSGAVAVTIAAEVPRVRITATDISLAALAVARQNAVRYAVSDRIRFLQADLMKGIRKRERFHAILSNPPYISIGELPDLHQEVREGDPPVALLSGPEGTEYYPLLAEGSMGLLLPGGSLMVEVGSGQDTVVAAMFERAGFTDIRVVNDLAGIGRVVKGIKKSA